MVQTKMSCSLLVRQENKYALIVFRSTQQHYYDRGWLCKLCNTSQ